MPQSTFPRFAYRVESACGEYEYSSVQKSPTAIQPHKPQAPWTAKASSGSSILSLRMVHEATWYTIAPTKPMTIDAQTSTVEQPAVILTSPPSSELQVAARSHIGTPPSWLGRPRLRSSPVVAPEAAASVVVTAARAASRAKPAGVIARVEPGLNPYQPNQRRKVPSTCSEDDWPAKSVSSPTKRPSRGRMVRAPIKAQTPPVRCTTPEPAKSIMPGSFLNGPGGSGLKADRKPFGSHTQWTTTG
mmetsp:Transcript_4984/g.16412  ORF Transcript_4984/g.16412 Transcript_4984/m.16412 type:complete len:245 (+) Transcript_4984:656-1390(+)